MTVKADKMLRSVAASRCQSQKASAAVLFWVRNYCGYSLVTANTCKIVRLSWFSFTMICQDDPDLILSVQAPGLPEPVLIQQVNL